MKSELFGWVSRISGFGRRLAGRSKRPRIGLALGGGAAKGWAHVGVIKHLLAAKIPIDLIAGTSIGAIAGAFFCAGAFDKLDGLA